MGPGSRTQLTFAGLILVMMLPAVAAAAPIANFAFSPAFPTADEPVHFTSTSTDSDGQIVDWQWRLGNQTAFGPNVTLAFPAGDHRIELMVVDNDDESSRAMFVLSVAPSGSEVRSDLPGADWFYWAFPLAAGAALLAIAAVVLVKGRPVVYNRVFFAFYAVSGTKSIVEAIARIGDGQVGAGTATVLRLCAALLIPLFLWFVLIFPRPAHPWLHDGRRGAVVLALALPFLLLGTTAFNVFATIAAAGCVALLWYHARDIDSDEESRRIRMLTVAFALLVLATLDLTIVQGMQSAAIASGDVARAGELVVTEAVLAFVVNPIIELVGAMLLLYAILRYQLLGIERIVMRVTRASMVAITVPVVFIVVGGAFEEYLEDTVFAGDFGFIFAGLIAAVALLPAQKVTDYLIARMFPDVDHQDPVYQSVRRMEIFEAQLRYSLLDNHLADDEIPDLLTLRHDLGLTDDELMRVLRLFPGVDKAVLAS